MNTSHIYDVHCEDNGDTLDIRIMMEDAEADNNILGSVVIEIPQKEFEMIETTGEFKQVFYKQKMEFKKIINNTS